MAGAMWRRDELKTVSRYLVPTGVAAGLLAAVPGIIDYRYSVPPRQFRPRNGRRSTPSSTPPPSRCSPRGGSSEGDRAARRCRSRSRRSGAAAISVGGWLGGTLAFRNQIGVDHRYANAGKWQEETRENRRARALTSAAAPLGVNQMKLVHVDDERIVVARTERGHAAFQDRCTHRGGPLSDGVLICGVVQCPWHGSQFDVETGEVKCGPAEQKIQTYEIEPAHVPVKSACGSPAISGGARRPPGSSRR